MFFNPSCKIFDWFVPPIIKGTEYESQWIEDLESVKDIIPQATQVMIVETGHLSKFLLKCEERLCSKAQWEIMNQTKLTAERFISQLDSEYCSKVFKNYASQLISKITGVTTKCQLQGHCAEGCKNGAKCALNRKF